MNQVIWGFKQLNKHAPNSVTHHLYLKENGSTTLERKLCNFMFASLLNEVQIIEEGFTPLWANSFPFKTPCSTVVKFMKYFLWGIAASFSLSVVLSEL